MILNLSPVITAVWSWLLWDERLVALQVLGMILVIGGVLLVQYRSGRPSRQGGRA
ncbi:MAG: EamA family transporter [Chloroflexi bacterium]|nr:EamA family transporter [Chloroflexota bacterium]